MAPHSATLRLSFLLLSLAAFFPGCAAEPSLTSLQDWRLREGAEGFLLVHTANALPPFQLHLDGGTPKLLSFEVATADPRIGLLHYYSGSAGTSQFYSFTRTVVIDISQRKIVGIVLKALAAEGGSPALRQPEWKWGKGSLTVRDREYGGETTLRW